MKSILLVVLCLCVYSALASVFVKQTEWEESLQAWQTLNLQNYQYTQVAFLDDSVYRTTIKVRKGVVVARTYQESSLFHPPGEILDFWTEKCALVGTHGDDGLPFYKLAPAAGLETVYNWCRDTILTQDSEEDGDVATFETFADGVIQACNYYSDFCSGCFQPIYIENLIY